MENSDTQNRRVINYFKKAAEEYDKGYEAPFFKELYDKITWRDIEPYLPKEGLVLDAGGGTGKWAIPIAERGLKVMIFDISQEMLNVALGRAEERELESHIRVKQGDICNIDFPDNHFDLVLAEGDPISYCSDPDKAVGELHRVLKPGCYIAAGVDSLFRVIRHVVGLRHDLDAAFRILYAKRFYAARWGFHCWAFTPKDLKQLFGKHGFSVVKIAGKPVLFSQEAEPLLEDPEKTKKLMELELALCEEETIIGYGGHLHIVARKPV